MKNILLIILLVQFNYLFSQVPNLSGTIEISITEGTIDGNMTLSNIPSINDYEILLNSGLNLDYIRDIENNYSYVFDKNYNSEISNESFLYSLKNKEGKFLPKELNFKYTGKFPVKNDTILMTNKGDWKGNIAFNGQNLRMDGIQTSWYPVIKDISNDKSYELVTYDIKVICNDCRTLYVNGNSPINSQSEQFKTNIPTEVLLFVGNYDFYKTNGIFYLNPDINESEMKEFSITVNKFKEFYAKKLSIPFKGNFNFIQTLPTSKKNAFLFVSYPSIVNIGRDYYGLNFFVNKKNSYAKPLIAHELGHYYFGSGYKSFNSQIGNVIQEGFSEYLSLLATKEILGKDVYKNRVENAISRFTKKTDISYLPISKIGEYKDFGNYYVYAYNYFPTILLAIEKETGEEKMWNWMRNLLTTKAKITDYDFLKSTLEQAINDKKKSDKIISKYFTSNKTLESAIEKINE